VPRSIAVVSPYAVELGQVERQPQHALPGSMLPPRDVVPPPGELTVNSRENQSINKEAVVLKHNKPRPRVAHRGITRFLRIDQKCNQVVPWSLRTFA